MSAVPVPLAAAGDAQPVSLLRLPEVMQRTGMRKSWIYEQIAQGAFPVPVRLGGGRFTAWASNEIDGWIRDRLAERKVG